LLDDSDDEARITALHVVSPKLPAARRESRAAALREALGRPGPFDPKDAAEALREGQVELDLSVAANPVHSIVGRTSDADLLVVGSSRAGWLGRKVFGRKPYLIARRSACPVVMVSPKTIGFHFGTQVFFQFFREEPER
jgi:nucleotide-binding universal stress UspA family protein